MVRESGVGHGDAPSVRTGQRREGGERAFTYGGERLASFADGEAGSVGVEIETPRGPVVESLTERASRCIRSIRSISTGSRPALAGGDEGRPPGRSNFGVGAAHGPLLLAAADSDDGRDGGASEVMAAGEPAARADVALLLAVFGRGLGVCAGTVEAAAESGREAREGTIE